MRSQTFALKEGKNGQRNTDPHRSWGLGGGCVRRSRIQDEEESSSIKAPAHAARFERRAFVSGEKRRAAPEAPAQLSN